MFFLVPWLVGLCVYANANKVSLSLYHQNTIVQRPGIILFPVSSFLCHPVTFVTHLSCTPTYVFTRCDFQPSNIKDQRSNQNNKQQTKSYQYIYYPAMTITSNFRRVLLAQPSRRITSAAAAAAATTNTTSWSSLLNSATKRDFSSSDKNSSSDLRHVTKISDLSRQEIASIMSTAMNMKSSPNDYRSVLQDKTLLMLFEKPSLRTRVSLETGMTQLGGHAIAYMSGDSPLGLKETYEDTGAVLSRMVDAVTARVASREQIHGLAQSATIPIINALDDWAHPMQMLADCQVMMEHLGVTSSQNTIDGLKGVSFAFTGDLNNNVTYDLMRTGVIMGMDVRVSGPDPIQNPDFAIDQAVWDECHQLAEGNPEAGTVRQCDTAEEAVAGCQFVYADSWMSYGIKGAEREKRLQALMPYQVTSDLMKLADPTCKFMNCLPAMRGEEQTADVIDGPQSIVFDQAENRLHAQKALLVKLINKVFVYESDYEQY